MTYKAKVLTYETRVHFFWTLVAIISILFCVYFYAIQATTRNIAERQGLERQVASLSSNLGALEFSLINKRGTIDLSVASVFGLSEVRTPIYVSRGKSSSLTLATPTR